MTIYAHGYEVVQKPTLDLTRIRGLRWIGKIAWLRVAGLASGLAFSVAVWGLIIVGVRSLIG